MTDLVYTPPGITISEQATPVPNISTVVAIPPSRVALVGPSIGYRSYTETVQLGATAAPLAKTGIDDATIIVSSLAMEPYALTGDYTVTQTGSVPEDATTAMTRNSSGTIPLGAIVYVTYKYTDSAFYAPYFSTDWDEIQSRYGAAVLTDGSVGSPLSLAAKIAMEQGARELILVPTKGSTTTLVTAEQLKAAEAMLLAREDVGIVVPLPVGIVGTDLSAGETSQVCTDLKTHIDNAIADGRFRIGVIGLDSRAARSHDALAAQINSARVMLVYPNSMNWYNGYTNLIVELGGYFLAAACAGRMAALQPQIPLTRKQIASFSSIPARLYNMMTTSFKNNLSGNGVAVVEQTTNGRLVVRHGVSTDSSSVLTREISITRAKDMLLRLVNQALENSGIIGSAQTLLSPIHIRGLVEGALQQALSIGIILGYSNLAVRQSPIEQTMIDVKFAYDPTYPLNKIMVTFSINVVTGAVQTTP